MIGAYSLFAFIAAAALCYGLLWLLRPILQRHALAHPNHRSSHKVSTPQGGGFGLMAATIAVTASGSVLLGIPGQQSLWLVLAATAFVAVVGAVDDVRPIEALPRLFLQTIGVAIVLIALPSDLRIVTSLPFWLERGLLALAILWFVNLVNFMDGIDWITVTETVTITAGLVLFGWLDAFPPSATLAALALCGATAGFAPFNKPAAKLFLGDVGSLSIGLLLAWLLVTLAGSGHFTAALLLPLYYLADTTITLVRRTLKGEPILQAHRSHFYQRALDGGFSVPQIVGRVLLLNIALVVLAATTLLSPSHVAHAVALAIGCVLVGLLIYRFEHGKA